MYTWVFVFCTLQVVSCTLQVVFCTLYLVQVTAVTLLLICFSFCALYFVLCCLYFECSTLYFPCIPTSLAIWAALPTQDCHFPALLLHSLFPGWKLYNVQQRSILFVTFKVTVFLAAYIPYSWVKLEEHSICQYIYFFFLKIECR